MHDLVRFGLVAEQALRASERARSVRAVKSVDVDALGVVGHAMRSAELSENAGPVRVADPKVYPLRGRIGHVSPYLIVRMAIEVGDRLPEKAV